jgi:hypothetical protein
MNSTTNPCSTDVNSDHLPANVDTQPLVTNINNPMPVEATIQPLSANFYSNDPSANGNTQPAQIDSPHQETAQVLSDMGEGMISVSLKF